MKSKNPKFIKKGICVLIALIVIVTMLAYVISGYRTNKLAIAKENSNDNLAVMDLSEYLNDDGSTETFLTNNSVIISNESDIRYVRLAINRKYIL